MEKNGETVDVRLEPVIRIQRDDSHMTWASVGTSNRSSRLYLYLLRPASSHIPSGKPYSSLPRSARSRRWYYLSTCETSSTLSSPTLQPEMSPHGIPPRLLTVCLIAFSKSTSAGTSSRTRSKPSLTLRLAIQTLVPSRSRIDGLRYIVPTRQRERNRYRYVNLLRP